MVSIFYELFLPRQKLLKRGIKELRHEFNVEGMEEIIKEIKSLKRNEYYKRMYDSFKLGRKVVEPGVRTKEERNSVVLINLAFQNLDDPKVNFSSYFMTFSVFYTIYTFLEYFYFMCSGRKLNYNDINNIYFKGLDERIIFGLDKFDEVKDFPKPTSEFFKKLKYIGWKDKKSKKFSDMLNDLTQYAARDLIGDHPTFEATEYAFILTLTACSAVNENKDKMTEKDVIKAYRTYFKLMRTDITQLVEEGVKYCPQKRGYLVCQKCGGYYQLEPGEFPDNFDKCQCGGELEYMENIEDLN